MGKKKYGLFNLGGGRYERRYSPKERKTARGIIHNLYKKLTITNPKIGIKKWF
jgi:hypothetical protein